MGKLYCLNLLTLFVCMYLCLVILCFWRLIIVEASEKLKCCGLFHFYVVIENKRFVVVTLKFSFVTFLNSQRKTD
jgi:hypothetical protein